MKKIFYLGFMAVCSTVSASAQQVQMKNSVDSFSYAAGINIARTMQDQGVTELNSELFKKAIEQVFSEQNLALTPEQVDMCLQKKLQEFTAKKLEAEKEKGKAFLLNNKTRKGVVELPNGLQYEVLKSGEATGAKPIATDNVKVHYVGTTIDGKEFDSSVGRGEPATFPLNRVIAGWTEILQHMRIGDKWKVYIPSELGYGERGAGGAIPPNATLIFEIELLDINPS